MDIRYRKSFQKDYKKLSKIQKVRVNKAIELFQKDPFNPLLKNHELSGKMEEIRSIAAGFDLRILLEVEGNYITVTMLEVGTHSQLY